MYDLFDRLFIGINKMDTDNRYRYTTIYSKFLIEKGSISINGVSLSISLVKKNTFQISIIPHTLKLTNLIKLKKRSLVNIEFDILGKYLINLRK